MWVYGRVILYMSRISEAVIRRACHDVAVIWTGTPKQRPKMFLRWWQGQGYLEGNIGSRIMSDIESWFYFVSSEGYRTARMRGMQGL